MKLAGQGSNNASIHSENETVLPVIPLHCQQRYTVKSLTVFSALWWESEICPVLCGEPVMMWICVLILSRSQLMCVCPGSTQTQGPHPTPHPPKVLILPG